MNLWNHKDLIETLEHNGVVVMPTDTLYGIVGRASEEEVVEKIYKIRKRNQNKRCIVLIGGIDELKKFNIIIAEAQKNKIQECKEPTSFIVDCPDEKFSYLHRGTYTLAFRIPAWSELRDLLLKTGPLIAPSANIEASSPAQTIEEAKKYFRNAVDLYIDGGELNNKASKIVKLHKDGSVDIIRE